LYSYTRIRQHPTNFALSSTIYRELTVARPWFDRGRTGIFPIRAWPGHDHTTVHGRSWSGEGLITMCVIMGSGCVGVLGPGALFGFFVKKNLLVSRLLLSVFIFFVSGFWKYVTVSYLCTPQTEGCGQFFEARGRYFSVVLGGG